MRARRIEKFDNNVLAHGSCSITKHACSFDNTMKARPGLGLVSPNGKRGENIQDDRNTLQSRSQAPGLQKFEDGRKNNKSKQASGPLRLTGRQGEHSEGRSLPVP